MKVSKVICGSSKHRATLIDKSNQCIGEYGEDVFMSLEFKANNKMYLAVADGVGSWVDDNIDPVEFPKALMTEIKKKIENEADIDDKSCSDIIQEAYAILRKEHDNGKRHYGSCTFCFVRIDLISGDTEIANIGDSAFAILRENNLHFNTRIAQKGFNCPYQIGLEMRGPELYLDCKSDTQTYKLQLKPGDKFVLATDGVWDGIGFDKAANLMASNDQLFSAAADIHSNGRSFNRKADDTTVIVAQVEE